MGIRRVGRRWVPLAGVLLLGALAGCGEEQPSAESGRAAQLGTATPTGTPTATPDPRLEAGALVDRGAYADAIALYETAGLDDEADRIRRLGARALTRSARRALDRGRHTTAKRLATRLRQLQRTAAARTVIRSVNAEIARAAAARRERERLARIARDQRTCNRAEKRTVDVGGGTPPGCADYARRQFAEEAVEQCDPNYKGACLKPDSPDYDCAGGSGDGPDYTGPVQVVGDDPHGLDADDDGVGCQNS